MAFPLKSFRYPDHQGRFGAVRTHDVHTGYDLYCDEGSRVFAIEDGVVVQHSQFTGASVGSPWWNDTDYLAIRGKSGTIVYGEIRTALRPGQEVREGDDIGSVVQVLKTNKMRPMSMLHLELYDDSFKEPVVWSKSDVGSPPPSLINPEDLIPPRRLDHDAVTHRQALRYMKTRAYQLLPFGFLVTSVTKFDWGLTVSWIRDSVAYHSHYILKSFRNRGLYLEIVDRSVPVLTVPDCLLANYLRRHEIPFYCQDVMSQLVKEYDTIDAHYGDRRAERSGILYMQHIDEGCAILKHMGCDLDTIDAFCYHPIVQSDADLLDTIRFSRYPVKSKTLTLALEYRQFANAYLAHRKIESISEFQLSPLSQVNQMLVADKIQNFKDLQLHNRGHHNFEGLTKYFENWHEKLGIRPNAHPILDEFAKIESTFGPD